MDPPVNSERLFPRTTCGWKPCLRSMTNVLLKHAYSCVFSHGREASAIATARHGPPRGDSRSATSIRQCVLEPPEGHLRCCTAGSGLKSWAVLNTQLCGTAPASCGKWATWSEQKPIIQNRFNRPGLLLQLPGTHRLEQGRSLRFPELLFERADDASFLKELALKRAIWLLLLPVTLYCNVILCNPIIYVSHSAILNFWYWFEYFGLWTHEHASWKCLKSHGKVHDNL